MKLYLPENLDIDEHIAQFPPVAFAGFKRDKLVYFLSLILSVPANNKDIANYGYGWVPLSSQLLAKVDKEYKKYLEYALGQMHPDQEAARIIKTDNQYIVAVRSKSYAYMHKYLKDVGVKPVEVGKAFSKKVSRMADEKKRKAIHAYPHILKWFDKDRLKIDGDAARNYAAILRDQGLQKLEGAKQAGTSELKDVSENKPNASYLKKKKHPNPNTQYVSYMMNIDRIEQGDYFFSVDENVRRLHTNLTNLKSELRNFLTYDGKKLVSLDVKNCQPFLATALFNPDFYLNNTGNTQGDYLLEELETGVRSTGKTKTRSVKQFHLKRIAPEIFIELRNTLIDFKPKEVKVKVPKSSQTSPSKRGEKLHISLLDSLIMYSKSVQVSDNEDYIRFISDVSKGEFYEKVSVLIEQRTDYEFKTSKPRKEVKEMMFLVLFTDNRFIGTEEARPKRVFKSVYPTVYEFFSLVKKKDKTVLPRLLQSIESWLILDRVCRRIAEKKPKMPIFTIHDSVVTTEGNEQYVRNVMIEEIEKFVKAKPALDVEKYYPEKLKAIGIL